MKKSLILVLVFALGVFGAMQPTYAQKKKKKKPTKVASQNTTPTEPTAPAAPVEVDEPLRTLSYDSIEYNSTGYKDRKSVV